MMGVQELQRSSPTCWLAHQMLLVLWCLLLHVPVPLWTKLLKEMWIRATLTMLGEQGIQVLCMFMRQVHGFIGACRKPPILYIVTESVRGCFKGIPAQAWGKSSPAKNNLISFRYWTGGNLQILEELVVTHLVILWLMTLELTAGSWMRREKI